MKPQRQIQKELIIEKKELDTKLVKLSEFLYTQPFHTLTKKHQALLIRQAEYMRGYSHILEARIADLSI